MKLFVTTVSGWNVLPVVIKKSTLVSTGVLDPPLLEIEMSKLNKHHINGRELYTGFFISNIFLQLSLSVP